MLQPSLSISVGTRLIGAVAAVRAMVAPSLVTAVRIGGTGGTLDSRTALHVARALMRRSRAGLWAAAAAAGIPVSNTPGVLTDATADLTLTIMLMLCRRAGEGERELRAGAWAGWRPTHLVGQAMTGKRLGIIGMGRIGKAVAQRAHFGFGMEIGCFNRSPVADGAGPSGGCDHRRGRLWRLVLCVGPRCRSDGDRCKTARRTVRAG